jgi:hypothetical protein
MVERENSFRIEDPILRNIVFRGEGAIDKRERIE